MANRPVSAVRSATRILRAAGARVGHQRQRCDDARTAAAQGRQLLDRERQGQPGPNTKRALQHYLGLFTDGVIGSQTVSELQRHVGANPDGIWGPDTTRHLQTALNQGWF